MRASAIRRALTVAALVAIPLSACKLLPEAEPLRLFMLPQEAIAVPSSGETSFPLALRVNSPQANRILSGSRIAVVPEGNELSSYGGARWSEPVPDLLQDRIIEAFMQSGRLAAVIGDQSSISADLELVSNLRVFQSEYHDGTPWVRIQLDVQLTRDGGRQLIASRRFEVREESADEDIESVVASFGRAGDRLSEQLVDWTMEQVATFWAASDQ